MKDLRQLIRESINEYIRSIDEAGENAALEAKMKATTEAIELREKKMNMEGLDEAYHDMLDKGKIKELSSEVKALKKSLAKYEKQLEKLKSKGEKISNVEDNENKEIVDEISLGGEEEEEIKDKTEDFNDGEDYEKISREVEYGINPNPMNESFLHMQKLAGLITEAQYQARKK